MYERAEKGKDYVMTVDVARGVGEDYSAFVVVDITEFPHKIVCKYRNNDIKPMLFPNIIYELAKNYKGGDMRAIVSLQEKEIELSKEGYTAIKHQQEVGSNYYETIGEVLLGEESELLSTKDSTETDQF